MISLSLADKNGLKWAQEQVATHHYLHKPVDVRCSPMAYLIMLENDPVGCLIYGRPESTKCNGWYGSVEDVATGKCRITRWQILNLARVYLHPDIQRGGIHFIENAATWAIAQSLRHVPYDFLIHKPPVFPEQPYELREVLSYCDCRIHQGTLYRAANFRLERTNDYGIETYVRPVRRLTHAEHKHILLRSQQDKRAQKLRSERLYRQLSWESSDIA